MTSENNGDFYWLSCPHSFRTEKNLNLVKKCKNKDFCNVLMSPEDNKILEFNQYHKSDKAPLIIYENL